MFIPKKLLLMHVCLCRKYVIYGSGARIVPLKRKHQYKFCACVYMYASVENMGSSALGGGGEARWHQCLNWTDAKVRWRMQKRQSVCVEGVYCRYREGEIKKGEKLIRISVHDLTSKSFTFFFFFVGKTFKNIWRRTFSEK